MTILVQKFGGSSLADLEQLHQVADLVARQRAAGDDVLVVVSAMGKTTEQLLGLAQKAGLPSSTATGPAVLPRRELDLLVSTGERVSMALLSMALIARGIDALSLTGSQAGIVTEPRHFDARILEIRPARVLAALNQGRVVIVAGYQGVSLEREVTTLGRGGSDTTAVALAAVLGAARCEIYSDVDGIYSADPHQISAARHLPAIDYATLREMTEAGARVLNARAVEWGQRHDVAIHARRTLDFARLGTGRETRVSAGGGAARARAVVKNQKLALISVDASGFAALAEHVTRAGLTARDRFQRAGRGYLTVALTSAPDFSSARRSLHESGLPALCIEEHHSEVCAVGDGVSAAATSLSASLPDPNLCVVSQQRVSAWVSAERADELEQRWHRLWVEAA